MNKAILHGNIGKDPEIVIFGENKKAKFSLATQSFRKDQQGNKVTDWHNIVAWGKLANLAEEYLKKGSSIIVEGEIQYGNYTDKQGVVKYFTEISASAIHFTGKKEEQKAENNEGAYVKSGKTVLDAASDTVKYQNDLNDDEQGPPF